MRQLTKVFAASILLFSANSALAMNLGDSTWLGIFQCKGIDGDGNKYKFKIEDVTLSIAHDPVGPDATVTADFGGGPVVYDARVVNDADKPDTRGALGFVHAAASANADGFNEVVWGRISYDPETGKGSFKGSGPRVTINGGFDTCSWKFKASALP